MPQKILIIEDSPVVQILLVKLLTKQGYEVVKAISGEIGVELAQEQIPDLILLDIVLPGIDGYDACKLLKSDDRTAHIPVIFISMLNSAESKIRGFEAGAVDYILKPFQASEVLARVDTHIRLRYLQSQLEEKNQQLLKEKQKSERLLCHVLPKSIAQELLNTGNCAAQLFTDTTVCFADIVDFTATSSTLKPEVIIYELNDVFTAFDRICLENNCERMKTIGDAYLFVSGMPESNPDHAASVAKSALEMVAFLDKRNKTADLPWRIRVGINSGPLVGGVVGTDKYLYDIFGDTVNISSRVQKSAQPMQVNVSSATYEHLKGLFRFTDGNTVEMKGKGMQTVYTLLGIR